MIYCSDLRTVRSFRATRDTLEETYVSNAYDFSRRSRMICLRRSTDEIAGHRVPGRNRNGNANGDFYSASAARGRGQPSVQNDFPSDPSF